MSRKHATAGQRRTESGFTLVELLVVISILGLVMSALAAAMVVILTALPSTQFRVDDARSTRGLQTWLSHDVASTPPNIGDVTDEGGFVTAPSADPCGAADGGVNILQMNWVQDNHSTKTEYVANYRLVTSGSTYRVVRYTCRRSVASANSLSSVSFGNIGSVKLGSGLNADSPCGSPPTPRNSGYAKLEPSTGSVVQNVHFCLTAADGGGTFGGANATTSVVLDVTSRNPVESLTP